MKTISGTIRAMEARMATAQNTLVVDLGPLRQSVEDRIQSGTYARADEVIRASLLALEREEAATNEWLTKLAEESLADPRPSVLAAQVFRELRAKYGIPASESVS
jgi:antitoxin ParD1/3/4